MAEPKVNGLRSIELDVFNLKESTEFYKKAWGLDDVKMTNGSAYLRATGPHHHVVALHEKPRAGIGDHQFFCRRQRNRRWPARQGYWRWRQGAFGSRMTCPVKPAAAMASKCLRQRASTSADFQRRRRAMPTPLSIRRARPASTMW